ncbi:microtubule-binding protein [Bdellovibrio bacteriovorus]|uniref:Microtubule binding protein n=1 Tax=Bdellovibrio bacteriovorus str. Tiberius TaxID=1069642 RepID=K7Z8R5_BDEBC|nr:microtubule-binding protein [Bdellovibrio bacteriovorus]AFY00849.1 microtubule binding protein [Bdellovibrio bacteriovorus str. Tiberius]
MGLSTIFLLLYVTSSLRTGTDALRGQVENQKLSMKVEELESQLKMYENVKNEYLAGQAPKDEVQEYEELMDKLTLLQEDAKTEKERLIQEARENGDKVKALNKYQQMVRNVLNANKMAKSKLINRDDLIKEQDVEIETQETEIADLNKDIQNKKQLIAQGEQKIAVTQAQLQKRLTELRVAYKNNKLSKQLFEQKMAQARADGNQKVAQLNQVNAQYQMQLNQANVQLGQVQGELSKTQGMLAQKEDEATHLAGALSRTKAETGARIAGLESGLADEKARGAKRVASLQEGFAEEKAAMAAGFGKEKAAMAAGYGKEKAALQGALSDTQGQLAKARAEIEARKSVAGEIQKGFAKAGIKADIDLQTGDVVLDFGQAYFDSDSDRLKHEMKGVLEKAMPIYSRSLFGNPKVSDKISAVEIIGFASPTYQGRFVDPHSSKPADKAALKYNMDLSYRRANSIFSYMLDEGNMRFEHQRELLALMKVSGRSFLEVMKVQNRNIATAAEFCKQNDCKKAQRVIIRFNMDQKK